MEKKIIGESEICQTKEVLVLGMPLMEWRYKSCMAHIAEFSSAATLYDIQSKEEGKGHASKLLIEAKKHYEGLGKKFGGSVALNERMRLLYKKLGIEEYVEG